MDGNNFWNRSILREKRRRLIDYLFQRLASSMVVALLALGLVWTVVEYRDFQHRAELLREQHQERTRIFLKRIVDDMVAGVTYERHQTERRVEETIRQRVEEAHSIATHLLEQASPGQPRAALETQIRESLRPIRFNNGRGYFFAFDLNGVERLFAARPELEGKNMLAMTGARGEFVVRDMIELVKTRGEGFYRYYWTQPDKPGDDHLKIAYVKLIAPLGWVVGTGEYVEDMEADIKKEVLARIEQVRFENNGYIFAGQWNGLGLAGTLKGRNPLMEDDPWAKDVVDRVVGASKAGGGFISYVMPPVDSRRAAPKTSYVSAIPDWKWYVGAGLYDDNGETEITAQRAAMVRGLLLKLLAAALLAVVLALISVLIMRAASRRAASDADLLDRALSDAAEGLQPVDEDRLRFDEHRRVAVSANRMIGRRREAEEALGRREVELRLIYDASNVGIFSIGDDMRISHVNHHMSEMFRLPQERLVGMPYTELITPEEQDEARRNVERHLGVGTLKVRLDRRYLRGDGTVFWGELSASTISGGDGIVCVITDITERRQAEQALVERSQELEALNRHLANSQEELRESELRFRDFALASVDWIWEADTKGIFTFVAGNVEAILGYRPEEMIGRTAYDFMPEDEARDVKHVLKEIVRRREAFTDLKNTNRHRDGSLRHILTSGVPLFDEKGNLKGYRGVDRDATDLHEKDLKILRLAYHDVLTGLPNRALLEDRVARALLSMQRSGEGFALLFLDLDHFKNVNDSLGHDVGDQLLVVVRDRILSVIRQTDTLARLGGDEFIVMLTDGPETGEIRAMADRIIAAIAQTVQLDIHDFHIGVSIGIAVAPDDGTTFHGLLKSADTAMYHAKAAGRSDVRFFDESMNAQAVSRLGMEARLRRAIDNGEFEIHYQPKVTLHDRSLCGAEALVRWRCDDVMVPPDSFIPIAEETGLIIPLGQLVLTSVLEHVRGWREAGLTPPRIAVNLSARQLHSQDIGDDILRRIAEYGLTPKDIELELTETLMMADPERAEAALRHLHGEGLVVRSRNEVVRVDSED